MAAIEFWLPLYPPLVAPSPENPDGVDDPRNWIIVKGLGGLQLTGAVMGTLVDGVVDTTLTPINTSQITNFSTSVTTQAKTISLDQFAIAQANINLNNKKIINLPAPDININTDIATVGFVKQFAPSQDISLIGAVTGELLNGVINTSLTPISTSQITDFVTDVDTQVKTISLDQFAVPQANISLNGFRLTTSGTPSGLIDSDVATVGYVKQFATVPNVSVTGAVTGQINAQGVIDTSLSAAQNLPSKFLHLNYEDTGIYGDPYFLSNFLPITDPEPILRFVAQTGSSSSQTLRRWDMNFKMGLGDSVTNEFELSMYHSLLPDNSITPLRISYSIADSTPVINIAGLLDIGNNNARSTASPTSVYHLANKGYVDYTVATYPLNLLVPTADLDLGGFKISSSPSPTLSTHLTNKSYVDAKKLNEFAVNNDVDLGVYKMSSSTAPTQGNHFCNKTYVDSNTIGGNIRTGQVIVGDIGGTTGTVALTVSGAIISATKRNGYSNSDSFIDITFSNKSYIPFVFVTINNNMGNSNSNDIALPVTILNTSTSARIYLEETVSTFQSVYLGILLINPNLS